MESGLSVSVPVPKSSVKIEITAKGLVQPTIHVYAEELESVLEVTRQKAVEQFEKTVKELREKGFTVVGGI